MASNLTGLPLLHQMHAERFAKFSPLVGARVAILDIISGSLEYALIELAAGLKPKDVRDHATAVLTTSPVIAGHGLVDFALDAFERGLSDCLAAIASAREGLQ